SEKRRVRLEQGAVRLNLYVSGQQVAENLLRRRLIEVVERRGGRGIRFESRNGQQTFDDDQLRHDRLELVVDEIDGRSGARGEICDRCVGKIRCIGKGHLLKDAHGLVPNVKAAATEKVAAFSADQTQRNLPVRRLVLDELPGCLDDVRVEAPAQPTIG